MLLRILSLLVLACASLAHAQVFPSKPIRIIVPTSPGGLTDVISRALATPVAESIGQPVVVENRAGAGSIIGITALAKSPPDGYTVAVTSSEPLINNPLIYTRLPYDAENDFSYVTELVRTVSIIVAHPSAPGRTFPELIAWAKANPGKLNFATWGPGSTPALYLEWINRQNGTNIQAIPYKGAGPSIPAIVSGEVHVTFTGTGLALPHLQAGKLRPLAIAGSQRFGMMPEVPSLATFGSDPDFTTGFGMYAPAKTPAPIRERLAAEFSKALEHPSVKKVMLGSMEPVGSTPAEFEAAVRKARVTHGAVFKALGIKAKDAPE
jgi:tripartite-type tricarboxylate transporter receptor subunit TctC